MPHTSPRPAYDAQLNPRSGRCEQVAAPREDQGVVNSLVRAFGVEGLPEEMRRMLTRIR